MRYHTERRGKADDDGIFYWEMPGDSSNVAVIFPTQADGLQVAVSETHAMDSYNVEFECSLHIPREQAERLRDLLNEWFPKTPHSQGVDS